MKLVPIRYCADVAASARFYTALGLQMGSSSRSGGWTELPAPSAMLALHVAGAGGGDAGSCELAFETDEPLEAVAERLRAAGHPAEALVDEAYGRALRVQDPDGVWVQVNEHDRELYT